MLLLKLTCISRRLYSWLLGSEVDVSVLPSENPVVKRTESVTSNTSCDQSTAYFDAYSRPLAIDAITVREPGRTECRLNTGLDRD